jgi:hypothetical protein
MTVEISVNWNFLGDTENAQVTYATKRASLPLDDQAEAEEDFPFLGSVLPLRSSVLAPGLSMPVPTH